MIKGALRRAFSRSDLHKEASLKNRIEHYDPNRPRCLKYSWCNSCGEVVPSWRTQLDHVLPVVPLDKKLEQMTWDELVSRMWCSIDNLQTLCEVCHGAKSSFERKERKALTNK